MSCMAVVLRTIDTRIPTMSGRSTPTRQTWFVPSRGGRGAGGGRKCGGRKECGCGEGETEEVGGGLVVLVCYTTFRCR